MVYRISPFIIVCFYTPFSDRAHQLEAGFTHRSSLCAFTQASLVPCRMIAEKQVATESPCPAPASRPSNHVLRQNLDEADPESAGNRFVLLPNSSCPMRTALLKRRMILRDQDSPVHDRCRKQWPASEAAALANMRLPREIPQARCTCVLPVVVVLFLKKTSTSTTYSTVSSKFQAIRQHKVQVMQLCNVFCSYGQWHIAQLQSCHRCQHFCFSFTLLAEAGSSKALRGEI